MFDVIDSRIEMFKDNHGGLIPNAIILNVNQMVKFKKELGLSPYETLTYRNCRVYLNQSQAEQDIRVGLIEEAFIDTVIDTGNQRKLPYFDEEE